MANIEEQSTDRFKRRGGNPEGNPGNQDGNGVQAWLSEGIAKLENRECDDAINLFKKILDNDPENSLAFEKLAIARSIKADLESIAEYLSVGKDCMAHEDWVGASEEFQTCLTIDPDHEEAKRLLDEVNEKLGKSDDHNAIIDESYEDDDESTFVISGFSEGLDFSNVDTEQQPDSVIEKAAAALEADELGLGSMDADASAKDDESFQPQIEEVIAVYESGDLVKAREMLVKMDETHPGHSQISYYLQIIETQLDSGKSQEVQEKAEALFKQGMEELEKDRLHAAEQCFEEVLAIKPDFNQAQLMLEKIREMKPSRSKSEKKPATEKDATPAKQPAPSKKKTPGSKSTTQFSPGSQRSMMRFVPIIIGVLVLLSLCYFFIVKYPEIRVSNHLDQAKQLVNNKEYYEALEELKAVQSINSNDVESWELTGSINLTLQRGYEAVVALEKALELRPEMVSVVMKLGDAYYLSGNFESAEKQYLKASDDMNYARDAYYKIGLSRIKMNKRDSGLIAFRRSVELASDYAPAHFEIGKLLKNVEDPEPAEQEFLIAIEKNPRYLEAYEELGDFYMDLEKPEQAYEMHSQPLHWIKPSSEDTSQIVRRLRVKLGQATYYMGEYAKSMEQINEAIMIKPDVNAYINLGRAHYRLNEDHQAIRAWQQALDIDRDNPDVHFRLGTVYHKLSDLKQAAEEYLAVIRIDPGYERAYTNIGYVYYQQMKLVEARQAWQKSLEINPEQPKLKAKLQEIGN